MSGKHKLAAVGLGVGAVALLVAVSLTPHQTTSSVPSYLLNPAVTQDTTLNTICAPGWTATVRPSSFYTTGLKRKQLATLGYPDQNLADYEEDHWIPLELGGAPSDERNLWPELWSDAHKKDVTENADHEAVCSGKMTLAQARWDMYKNWRTDVKK